MGYNLHITRKDHWSDPEDKKNITIEEWLNYVNGDPELKLTNGYKFAIPSIDDRWIDKPGWTEWLSHPDAKFEFYPWFDYEDGSIDTKNPDLPTLKKMLSIAEILNAKVQGDDGELYDENYIIEEMKRAEAKKIINKKPWWKFW